MKEQQFPRGRNEERLKKLIEHYDSLSEEEQVAEDEAGVTEQAGQTVVAAPDALMPAIRQLISEHTATLGQ